MWLLGVVLALVPIVYGVNCLQVGRTKFFGSHGVNLEVEGPAGVALSIAYISLGMFIHGHWFWGLHSRLVFLSPVIKVLAALLFVTSFGIAMYKIIL